MAKKKTYGVSDVNKGKQMAAPKLPYEPRGPRKYKPRIGLIACGGITQAHLTAYKKAGFNVVALCDLIEERAENRRKEFYPDADVYTNYREVLERDDIDVVDIATHPPERVRLIEDALRAKKHVLSQKPFVLDLKVGQRLVDLADKQGVRLAVNQNGRWAPHFSYIRHAIQKGLIGEPMAAHLSVHWDHSWIGTHAVFNEVYHIILYDFAIHWFDALTTFMLDKEPKRVHASLTYAPGQTAKPPLLGQALVEYDGAQATLAFDALTHGGDEDRTYIAGTEGTIKSVGPSLSKQTVTLYTKKGEASPALEGTWFPDGFLGTMAELLRAIEEDREPTNSARNNLKSLALCFAAVRSAETGKPQVPGQVNTLPLERVSAAAALAAAGKAKKKAG